VKENGEFGVISERNHVFVPYEGLDF